MNEPQHEPPGMKFVPKRGLKGGLKESEWPLRTKPGSGLVLHSYASGGGVIKGSTIAPHPAMLPIRCDLPQDVSDLFEFIQSTRRPPNHKIIIWKT